MLGFSVLVVVASALALYLGRSALATRLLARALAEHGLVCDRPALVVSSDLARIRVEPATCRADAGRLARVAFPRGIELGIDVRALRLSSIDAAVVAVATRSVEVPDYAAASMLGESVPDPMARALVFAASLAGDPRVPRVNVEELQLDIESTALVLERLRLEPTAGRINLGFDALSGPTLGRGPMTLGGRIVGLRGNTTVSDAVVTGRLVIDVELARLDVDRAFPFELHGEALDTARPQVTLTVQRSPRLDAVRARLSELRASHEARRQSRANRVGGFRDESSDPRDTRQEPIVERAGGARSRLDERLPAGR